MPEPSRIGDPADPRRVRALVVDLLEEAAAQGHTVLPSSWVIRRARERALQPPCPLGENVLDASSSVFAPVVEQVVTGRSNRPTRSTGWWSAARSSAARYVNGKKGKPHTAAHDWRVLVDEGLAQPLPKRGEDRISKSGHGREGHGAGADVPIAALGVDRSRWTGKTTLLTMLCALPEVATNGVLLLAPTGKARVRLEEQTGQRGAGRTLAQFLNGYRRYDGETGAYFPDSAAPRCGDFRTVIVDECSMLTEEQLAALFDACTNVERMYWSATRGSSRPSVLADRSWISSTN